MADFARPQPRLPTPRYRVCVARYRLTIAYDGTLFHGWQRQYVPPTYTKPIIEEDVFIPQLGSDMQTGMDPDSGGEPVDGGVPVDSCETGTTPERPELRTVQRVLQRAVREVVREPVMVTGASRTDAGVHARGQTASFSASDNRRGATDERLMQAINARLPPDVLVVSAQRVHEEFDAISDCVRKWYRYTLHTDRERPLWDRNYVHHVYAPLDDRLMQAAADRLVGEHDFAAFAAAGHGRESTVRTVYACSVNRVGQRINIDIIGNGFLWNMVRIVAGTLIEVGRGKKPPEMVTRAIQELDRRLTGQTMPGRGLCLMKGWYPGDDMTGADGGVFEEVLG